MITPAIAQASLLSDPLPHLWTGSMPTKGLGIYGRAGASLVPREVIEGPGAHSLAVDVHLDGHEFSVLGVWSHPLNGTGYPTPYMGALAAILDRHEELLATGQTIVAGDINSSGQSSPDSFAGFFETLLDRHGLVSAYHHHTGHGFGEEPDPTLFWLHKREAPYHCDVILVPESWAVKDVHVGDFDTWCAAQPPHRHSPGLARAAVWTVSKRWVGSGC